MTKTLKNLQNNIHGEVFSSEADLKPYQTDESIFTVQPQIVVCPKNDQDVVATVQWADEQKMPITARGGGTGVAGQSIGSGIVLDFSKHMNQILELSKDRAIVQPGVVLGNLNAKALELGAKFGPDPGSWDRCTLGGMISTNAAGPHALIYGSTRDHIQSLELVLSNGKQINSQQLSKEMNSFVEQISRQASLIHRSKRNVDKNSSGYFLEALLETPPSFEKLIVGSEGTLALVTQATMKLVELPKKISFAVFGFESMGKALMNVKPLREAGACCIELVDQTILDVVRKENSQLLQELGIEHSTASLWVEWNQSLPEEWKKTAGYSTEDTNDIRRIWKQRSSFSKWLHAQAEKNNRKPLRCIEDACVPMDSLIQYVMSLTDLMERHDCKGAIFGHVGNGHLHVNPAIRTDIPNLVKRVQKLMDEFYQIVIEMGGTISGEHGDGLLRVSHAKKQWKEIWPLFEFIKRSFDPKGILNPDRKVPVQVQPWPSLKY